MYITLTMYFKNQSFDISVDSRQKIMAVYTTLYEAGRIKSSEVWDWYRSDAGKCMVSAHRTFEEEGIYSGDILTAV